MVIRLRKIFGCFFFSFSETWHNTFNYFHLGFNAIFFIAKHINYFTIDRDRRAIQRLFPLQHRDCEIVLLFFSNFTPDISTTQYVYLDIQLLYIDALYVFEECSVCSLPALFFLVSFFFNIISSVKRW